MKTIVAGAGETGYNIAAELSENPNYLYPVSVIDADPRLLREIQQSTNVGTFHGSCTDPEILEKTRVGDADLFIACTSSDEINLIACLLAKELGCRKTVAIVRANIYRREKLIRNYRNSGVDHILNTTQEIVREIFEVSKLNRNATEILTFAENKVTLLSSRIGENSKLNGLLLKDADFRGKYLIGCIVRSNEAFIPRGDDGIMAGDLAYFVLPTKNLKDIKEDLDLEMMNYHKAVVAGNDLVSYEIALGLANKGLNTAILSGTGYNFMDDIKKNKRGSLSRIEGSPLNIGLQLKSDIPNCALYVAMMDDYTNIASCMAAKYLGAQKTISMINHSDMYKVADLAGVDVHFSRRLVSLRYVKKILLGENIETYTTIGNTPLEMLTLDVAEGAEVSGKYLKDVKFPKNSLVALINDNQGNFIIPTGATQIRPKNQVILFTMPENQEKLKTLFL